MNRVDEFKSLVNDRFTGVVVKDIVEEFISYMESGKTYYHIVNPYKDNINDISGLVFVDGKIYRNIIVKIAELFRLVKDTHFDIIGHILRTVGLMNKAIEMHSVRTMVSVTEYTLDLNKFVLCYSITDICMYDDLLTLTKDIDDTRLITCMRSMVTYKKPTSHASDLINSLNNGMKISKEK